MNGFGEQLFACACFPMNQNRMGRCRKLYRSVFRLQKGLAFPDQLGETYGRICVFNHGGSPFGSNWFYYNTQLEQIKSFLKKVHVACTLRIEKNPVYIEKVYNIL